VSGQHQRKHIRAKHARSEPTPHELAAARAAALAALEATLAGQARLEATLAGYGSPDTAPSRA
jgi:hypothetical protein